MKPETADWVQKAEGDFHTASREYKVTDQPNYDAVCFHAQQCAEKYLKAILTEMDRSFPRIHDLEALLNLIVHFSPACEELRVQIQQLTSMAVEVRYPRYDFGLRRCHNCTRSC